MQINARRKWRPPVRETPFSQTRIEELNFNLHVHPLYPEQGIKVGKRNRPDICETLPLSLAQV
jgi:hypothetical protein